MSTHPAEPELEQFEPMVCCRGERNNLAVDRVTGEIFAECACCGNMQRLYSDDEFAEAEADGVASAEDLARTYGAMLGLQGGLSDAEAWAEVLHWFANRLRGGQLSVIAHWDFADRFGLSRDFKPGGDRG